MGIKTELIFQQWVWTLNCGLLGSEVPAGRDDALLIFFPVFNYCSVFQAKKKKKVGPPEQLQTCKAKLLCVISSILCPKGNLMFGFV